MELSKKEKKELKAKFKNLEKTIGYKFKDISILKAAFTHKSYVGLFNITRHMPDKNNERLEFLGDSVLGYVVTSFLYKKYKNLKEGELSEIKAHLVCKTALSKIARELSFNKYLIFGRGITEKEIVANDSVLEDTVEALIGAMYLDGGIKKATKFIHKFIIPADGNIEMKSIKDAKSRLQEILQASGNVKIEYIVKSTSGPEHDKRFDVEVYCNGKLLGEGTGKSKKQAEQEAAGKALLIVEDKTSI